MKTQHSAELNWLSQHQSSVRRWTCSPMPDEWNDRGTEVSSYSSLRIHLLARVLCRAADRIFKAGPFRLPDLQRAQARARTREHTHPDVALLTE